MVISAHIDSKAGTPGALDNAAGATVLLLLAELLADYDGKLPVELVPFNGEDNYSVAGQKLYLARNEGQMGDISLNVNLDGLGWRGSPTAYSFYECTDEDDHENSGCLQTDIPNWWKDQPGRRAII